MSLPEIIGGKYRPKSILGAGSTGTVYSVEHTLTGEELALKVMTSHLGGSEDAIARFKREALVVSKIRSPHVVRIFDADVAPELGGAPFLVMDLLEGVDLEELSDENAVEPSTVVQWLRQVAKPLDKAHRLGIIHRDLKPANLFLTQRDDGGPLIKILDFGIARIAAESMSVGSTQWGQLLGTPLYMAPEQARGDPTQVSAATDLYALGLTAYKLLTRCAYRTGVTLTGMLEEILQGPLKAPSELGYDFGPEFDVWFLRACHADPSKRFTSAERQIEALAQAFGLPVVEVDESPISLRDSLPGPWGTPQTDPKGITPEGLATVPRPPPLPKGTAPTPSTGLEHTQDSARSGRNGWRAAFFAIALFVVFPLLLLLFGRRGTAPAPAPATLLTCASGDPSACGSTGATAAVTPSTSAQALPSASTVRAEAPLLVASDTKIPVVSPIATQSIRVPPAVVIRPAPARVVVSRPRNTLDDDPLSDQR